MNNIYLMIVISELYNIDDLNQIIFNESAATFFKGQRNKEERTKIYESLQEAENNPNYDYKSIMKDTPVVGKLEFSNNDIHTYLMNFKAFMENTDFNLL